VSDPARKILGDYGGCLGRELYFLMPLKQHGIALLPESHQKTQLFQ